MSFASVTNGHSYVELPEIDDDLGEVGGSMSISLWLRPTQDPKRTVAMVAEGTNGHQAIYGRISFAGHPDNTNDGFFEIYHKPNDGSDGGFAQISSTTLPTVNAWHHLVLVQDGVNSTIKFYLNGSQLTTGEFATQQTYDNTKEFKPLAGSNHGRTWYIGSAALGDAYHNFVGQIDEVGVWDSALTTSEITSLSNGTSPGTIQTNNLKAYYDFEDNTNDQSGNSKDAVGTSNTSYNASTPYN